MMLPFSLPVDVVEYVRDVFRECNHHVSSALSDTPTTHEPTLDHLLIDYLRAHPASGLLGSNWVVRIDATYMGGGHHHHRWEVADIGLLVFFKRAGRVERVKLALLQSKRLYPLEDSYEEELPAYGFSDLLEKLNEGSALTRAIGTRRFTFSEESRYDALKVKERQYEYIESFENDRRVPVQYLLYNPLSLPESVVFPLTSSRQQTRDLEAGCRVVPARELRAAFDGENEGYQPSYTDLRLRLPAPFNTVDHPAGWSLEHFVADLVLRCRQGYAADDLNDERLIGVTDLYRRGAPIWAAIAVTVEAPGQQAS
jgi:hypothetical protein